MNTISAFARGMAHRDDRPKVFDWDKAARLIRERKPFEASAGLAGDWEWTGGIIWRDSKPVPAEKTYTYLGSVWATPELEMDGYVIDCWKWEDETPGWDSRARVSQ